MPDRLIISLKMDALSRLLLLYPVQAVLDYRCRFAAAWQLDEPAASAGMAPYHLITSGRAVLDLPGTESLLLETGDIVVLPFGTAHRLRDPDLSSTGPSVAARYTPQAQTLPLVSNAGDSVKAGILCGRFCFDALAAGALLAGLPALMHIRAGEGKETGALQRLAALLQVETESPLPGASAVSTQLASALFLLLVRAWLTQSGSPRGLFALAAEPRLQRALRAILETPEGDWTVQTLAGTCGMSRATFARLFRRCAGMAPAALLESIRMAMAARMLAQGERSTAAVAEAIGYASEAAFRRAFARHLKLGPGEFRRTRRSQPTMA